MFLTVGVVFASLGIFGLVLIEDTFIDFLRYYLKPLEIKSKFRFFVFGKPNFLNLLLLDGSLKFISLVLVAPIFELGNLGKNALDEMFQIPYPILIVLIVLLAGMEELVFRIFPWLFTLLLKEFFENSNWSKQITVLIAIVSSLIFGILHVFNYSNTTNLTLLATVPQILGGLVYWYTLEKKGILAPIILHAVLNISIFTLILSLTSQ